MAVYINGEKVGTVTLVIPTDAFNLMVTTIALVSAVMITSVLVKVFRRL